jgi:hypothetical protein
LKIEEGNLAVFGRGKTRSAPLRRWGCPIGLTMASVLLGSGSRFSSQAYVMYITFAL